jgi:hypothetical protein
MVHKKYFWDIIRENNRVIVYFASKIVRYKKVFDKNIYFIKSHSMKNEFSPFLKNNLIKIEKIRTNYF